MKASGRRLKIRVFLEGVEVPAIAVQVPTAPNSPSICVIQMPPLPEGTRLLPRTIVHVFFLDLYEGASPYLKLRADSQVTRDPSSYARAQERAQQQNLDQSVIDAEYRNHQYKLLFCGEIIGFQWTKNPDNRSLVLQCQDLSNYWDYAYQWNNTDLFGPGYKAIFSGGATNLFTDFLEDEGSVIARIIQTPSVQYPKLEGLLGGIVHLLEAIGGSYYAPDQTGRKTKFAGQNIFFSLAELRLHITQMITAYPDDPTAKRLMTAGGYGGMLGRTLGGLGGQVSIRKAINALMGVIFHETYAQPCPLYVPGKGGTVGGYERKKLKDDPNFSFAPLAAESIVSGLAELKSATSKDAVQIGVSLDSMKKTCDKTAAQLRPLSNVPAAAGAAFSSASSSLGMAIAKVKTKKTGAFGPEGTLLPDIVQNFDDAIAQLQKVTKLEANVTAQKDAVPARLNQQIFRPDVWFSSPPRCNVIFPDRYTQFNYTRMFLQEPTRLLLKTNDEFFGEDELFDSFYFAPKSFTVKTQKNNLNAVLQNDLLEHELFTGIIPVFEKMGELNIFAARSGTVNGKNPKVGLAQRSANFLYFKYRFAARQMQISCLFNPYVACGFPGLVIDKYASPAALATHAQLLKELGLPERKANKILGTHFLGSFTEVTHMADQRSGKTDIVCSYPRQPDEGIEFLGAIEADQTVQKRFPEDALSSTDLAAFTPPQIGTLGPKFGVIQNVEEVTTIYQAPASDPESGQLLPIYQLGRRSGTAEALANVPVGVSLPASTYGQPVIDLVGNPDQLVLFKAYRVQEMVPRYREEKVDLPAEEYIRPGWYGDIWHPSNIGKAYEHFFQTGSITDPQQIADPSGASTGVIEQDAEDALATAASGVNSEDPRTNAPAIYTLEAGSSIEQAVAFLVSTYSYIKNGGLDVEEFIRAYNWRPIASMLDMFGTSDLTLSEDGTEVVAGIEGFHSRAFGPFNDLFGLVTPEIENIVGIKRNSTVAQKGDVRKRRQDAVKELVSELLFSRAILG